MVPSVASRSSFQREGEERKKKSFPSSLTSNLSITIRYWICNTPLARLETSGNVCQLEYLLPIDFFLVSVFSKSTLLRKKTRVHVTRDQPCRNVCPHICAICMCTVHCRPNQMKRGEREVKGQKSGQQMLLALPTTYVTRVARGCTNVCVYGIGASKPNTQYHTLLTRHLQEIGSYRITFSYL